MKRDLRELLSKMAEMDASDLHVAVGHVPRYRIHGTLVPADAGPVSSEQMETLLEHVLYPKHRSVLEEQGDVDLVHVEGESLRLRTSAFRESEGFALAFRRILREVPELESLGLPAVAASFADLRHGLVVIAGPPGSGRTTTLGALVRRTAETSQRHIISIEDPIEYLHQDRASLIHQRQVGSHVQSMESGIAGALSQSPDVVAVGELCSPLAVRAALEAAEAGVLVLATVAANGALRAMNKLLDAFPGQESASGRAWLSRALRAVLVQHLLPRQYGTGLVAACEVLLNTETVAPCIRENRRADIRTAMVRCRALGMCLLDDSLEEMVEQNLVHPEDAAACAEDPSRFEDRQARTAAASRPR